MESSTTPETPRPEDAARPEPSGEAVPYRSAIPVWATTIVVIGLAWTGDMGSGVLALLADGILEKSGVTRLQDWPMHAPVLVGASFLSWTWCLTIVCLLGCWLHRKSPFEGLSFRNPGHFQLTLAPLLGLLMATVGACVSYTWGRTDTTIARMTSTPEGLFWVALMAIPLGAAEEVYYRGFIFPRLSGGLRWIAGMALPGAEKLLGGLAATGMIVAWFGLIHLQQLIGSGAVDWLSLSMVTFAGLVFTVQRWTTDSTLPSLITHVTYNSTLIALALLPV